MNAQQRNFYQLICYVIISDSNYINMYIIGSTKFYKGKKWKEISLRKLIELGSFDCNDLLRKIQYNSYNTTSNMISSTARVLLIIIFSSNSNAKPSSNRSSNHLEVENDKKTYPNSLIPAVNPISSGPETSYPYIEKINNAMSLNALWNLSLVKFPFWYCISISFNTLTISSQKYLIYYFLQLFIRRQVITTNTPVISVLLILQYFWIS